MPGHWSENRQYDICDLFVFISLTSLGIWLPMKHEKNCKKSESCPFCPVYSLCPVWGIPLQMKLPNVSPNDLLEIFQSSYLQGSCRLYTSKSGVVCHVQLVCARRLQEDARELPRWSISMGHWLTQLGRLVKATRAAIKHESMKHIGERSNRTFFREFPSTRMGGLGFWNTPKCYQKVTFICRKGEGGGW